MIELLVVATIIIILTTLGLVSYRTAVNKSHQAKCESDLQSVRQAMVMYKSDKNEYPTGGYAEVVELLRTNDYLGNDDFNDPPSNTIYVLDSTDGTTFTLTAGGTDSNCSVSIENP